MIYLLILVIGFLTLTCLGYWAHYCFHKRWSGRLYNAHMSHHTRLYPKTDLVSENYRHAGKDNTVWLFAIVFSPFILGALLLTIFGILPLGIGVEILGLMVVVSYLNNALHDAYHLRNSFWHRLPFFERLRKLHFLHHNRMNSNFGIINFFWDRVFGTYRE
jgi:sterol desaturase/sphingolipid hydroxylase (fatty acid hydroxylase superfamily)